MIIDTFSSHFQVYPLIGFPNPAIAEASERLVREQQAKYAQDSRILQQVRLQPDQTLEHTPFESGVTMLVHINITAASKGESSILAYYYYGY